MGAGHDTVARELVRRARAQGHEADTVDLMRLLPYGTGPGLRAFYRTSVRHAPWVYDGLYRAFLRPGDHTRPSGVPLARLAAEGLDRLVARTGADLVVPVFHLAAQLTGYLRTLGRLRVPSVVFVLDFAVHRQWLHPGNDACLCLTDEAADDVRRALPGTHVEATGPVVAPEFSAPAPAPGADDWRKRFERYAPGRPPVLLSAGAWGAAAGLGETARLLTGAGYLPVVLCGRNQALRSRTARVRGTLALDWVTDMPGLLHGVRALVDNAAGQTAAQALAAGLPVVGHRPLPGHGAEGVRRMAGLGLSEAADDGTALLGVLDRIVTEGPGERERRAARGRAVFRADVLERAVALAGRSAVPSPGQE
ncbi:galactosyldiacylglycerol synthase [Streptomyces griseorubens]|uniref:Galactosyldiacylglycerol synthase n=2 Tax=Streptomyces griseorubens TaxID=66897 RepID=A0ABR4T9N1_9ACTN|nr:galactosyldiacylglycerol synthase [Streptomyces griseorubens]KEG44148.1 galactosyldiacylglycerol synthase [Streptomyces griseorubens]